MWSFARQQKYNFCPRAFYFRYKELDSLSLNQDIYSQVLEIRQEEFLEFSRRYLLRELAKEVFYLRPESLFEVRKLIFRKARNLEVADEELDKIVRSLELFFESEFYRETNPVLVNHVQVGDIPSFKIDDIEVIGSVHLAWITKQGQFHIVKVRTSSSNSNLSFSALYAIKKFQVTPEKLNIGILNTRDWFCSWEAVDWHLVSELQDKALSFTQSENFSEYPATEHISRCDICEYSQVCYRYSSELDSI